MRALKKLDGFSLSKISEGGVRTVGGAIVSLVSLLVMTLLLFAEVRYYFSKDIVDHLHVNTTMAPTIKASFDLTFPEVPCGLLTIDAVDETGEPQGHALHEVFKHRIDSSGNKSGGPKQHRIGEALRSAEDVDELAKVHFKHLTSVREHARTRGDDCGNCYGAGEIDACCKTCLDVEKAYEQRGWRFHRQGIAQCYLESLEETEKEGSAEDGGCQIYGELYLSRATGHFHVVPHKNMHSKGVKAGLEGLLELLSFTFDNFDVSHTVNSLSFGDTFPGVRSPLDGQQRALNDTHGMYQYYVKVVPTRYKGLGGAEIESNQYAVTEHMRHLSPGSGRGLPGVYFYYELSPMQAVFEERRKGLVQFLTGACAVVGGVYTVMGMVDALLNSVLKFQQSIL